MYKLLLFTLLVLMTLAGCSNSGAYDSTEAIKRGDITFSPKGVHSLDRFEQFLNNVSTNKEDAVRVTSYTIEGDPIFEDLQYDGEKIQYSYDNSNDAFGGNDKGIDSDVCTEIISKVNEQGKEEYYITGCSQNTDYVLLEIPEAKK
ncbi:hypothetical protein AEA09_12745 [Lysinibacillus contaminans]|uniref:DUF4362 domain-containing protein n=1 Tax=Lysinibacillus contaminans TaxID=1293441 RepID=A0ABR5K3P9_9BACI|nr:DUF4362 domain-containing protein [Lysinibacillus contaminans]KOS69342.1 hypothetical protein AEA09_12745 [Lysinibacillus contaminans]